MRSPTFSFNATLMRPGSGWDAVTS